MPRPDFFRKLGLFVQDSFLDLALCAEVCAEMCCAASNQGEIFLDSGEGVINENVRRVMCAKVQGPNKRLIQQRLEGVRPGLEEHFRVRLAATPPLEFLIYPQGALYTRHTDINRDTNLGIQRRSVSVVIFLNGHSEGAVQDCYGGGKLTFHGILKEPEWINCAFSLDPCPGLLVAFPSDVSHEVKPVTFGTRFTIVSWFLAEIGLDQERLISA